MLKFTGGTPSPGALTVRGLKVMVSFCMVSPPLVVPAYQVQEAIFYMPPPSPDMPVQCWHGDGCRFLRTGFCRFGHTATQLRVARTLHDTGKCGQMDSRRAEAANTAKHDTGVTCDDYYDCSDQEAGKATQLRGQAQEPLGSDTDLGQPLALNVDMHALGNRLNDAVETMLSFSTKLEQQSVSLQELQVWRQGSQQHMAQAQSNCTGLSIDHQKLKTDLASLASEVRLTNTACTQMQEIVDAVQQHVQTALISQDMGELRTLVEKTM